jgi:hypothetical protein
MMMMMMMIIIIIIIIISLQTKLLIQFVITFLKPVIEN